MTERGPLDMGPDDLVPVVAQDHVTGEIRMVAYASIEAVRHTLETGRATFFSRSRGELWEKGRTSGHTMAVEGVLVDCDADTLVYLVAPAGPSCHTGRATCFYRRLVLEDGQLAIRDDDVPPAHLLERLERTLEERKKATAAASYVKSLYEGGAAKIGAKLREEADELAVAVDHETDDRVVKEAADVLFHVMVALRARGVAVDDVLAELERRSGTSGHVEKAARKS